MSTYFVTFNMTSRATVTGAKFQSNCDTVEDFVSTLYSNPFVICPEYYGQSTVVNMRNVETIIVTKVEE